MSDTADYGLGIIKARTPVRTGRLQNSWFTKVESWNQFYFDNSARYAPFVEAKVLMSSRSRPEIERYLARSLDENIEREMN
ncbi:HK97 gp10 family phage protein [Nodosilinea sp. LEGE 07298]|nr:HK97 gp10 family phage protein [Nodosilinea sp. LEGE 07298]